MRTKRAIRQFTDGLFIAVQFFTIIPLKKELQLDQTRLKKAIQLYPLIGLFLGSFVVIVILIGQLWTSMSHASLSLLVLTISVVFSGGLHLDGWMDASDAYFSYRDKNKRLEIMDDPRTGSFAVLSLLFLLGWRYLFIFEIISHSMIDYLVLILLIPFFARLAMVFVFYFSKLAKGSGLAAFFKKALEGKDIRFHIGSLIAVFTVTALLSTNLLLHIGILFGVTLFFFFFCKWFIARQFGGMSGDTLGATVEGVETVLWLTLWLLL